MARVMARIPRQARAVVLTAVAGVAMLASSPSAHAATFNADPASLGAIADGGTCFTPGAARDVVFTVSGLPTAAPTDISVGFTLNPSHGFVGDLDVELFAPGGAPSQTIFSRTGFTGPDCFGANANVAGPYTFSDSAPTSPTWWAAAAAAGDTSIPSGSYRAAVPVTGANTLITPAFSSATNPNGTWTLRFRDGTAGTTGTVSAATLVIIGSPLTLPAAQPPAGANPLCATLRKKLKKAKTKAAKRKIRRKLRRLGC
jgi:subtilisin-like proprotein convertase family protein